MGLLAESIDRKFGEAEQLFLAGKNPFVIDEALVKMRYEIIGLDCESGGPGRSRYLLSRHCIDSAQLSFKENAMGNPTDMDITNYLVRIPRAIGDHRAFEDLSKDALAGEMFHVDATRDMVASLLSETPYYLGAAAIQALAEELASLRVSERLPLS